VNRRAPLVALAAGWCLVLCGVPCAVAAEAGGTAAGAVAVRPSVPALAPREVLAPPHRLKPLQVLVAAHAPSLKPRSRLARRNLWRRAFASATLYARHRLGRVSVALVDDQGRLHGYRRGSRHDSASLVKAMLMVSYLRRREIRHRPLSRSSRALLAPMITRSDNGAATAVRNIVGNRGLARLARRAGMRHFATAASWGDTQIAAADQARFFIQIDRLVPPRHRRYALRLLSHVIAPQRWGIPAAAGRRERVFLKGGWRPEPSGWEINQAALVERGGRRMSLAVLTDHDRTDGYGHETVRGVAARLLRVLAVP
jgi:hypothetical protein